MEESKSNNTNDHKEEHVVTDEQYALLRKHISVYGMRVIMTDDQIKSLKEQISLYQTLSPQLHKQFTDHHDDGSMLRSIYSNPPAPTGHIFPTRPRWTPRPLQLQYLETVYDQCNGTPSKQEIKAISAELIQHGPITESNVYNWFQNRRARSKRQQRHTSAKNKEKIENDNECSKEVTNAIDDDRPDSPLLAEQIFFQAPHEGIDQLIGKMEAPRRCSGFFM